MSYEDLEIVRRAVGAYRREGIDGMRSMEDRFGNLGRGKDNGAPDMAAVLQTAGLSE